MPQDGVGVLAGGDDHEPVASSQSLTQEATDVPREELVIPAIQLHDLFLGLGTVEELAPRRHLRSSFRARVDAAGKDPTTVHC